MPSRRAKVGKSVGLLRYLPSASTVSVASFATAVLVAGALFSYLGSRLSSLFTSFGVRRSLARSCDGYFDFIYKQIRKLQPNYRLDINFSEICVESSYHVMFLGSLLISDLKSIFTDTIRSISGVDQTLEHTANQKFVKITLQRPNENFSDYETRFRKQIKFLIDKTKRARLGNSQRMLSKALDKLDSLEVGDLNGYMNALQNYFSEDEPEEEPAIEEPRQGENSGQPHPSPFLKEIREQYTYYCDAYHFMKGILPSTEVDSSYSLSNPPTFPLQPTDTELFFAFVEFNNLCYNELIEDCVHDWLTHKKEVAVRLQILCMLLPLKNESRDDFERKKDIIRQCVERLLGLKKETDAKISAENLVPDAEKLPKPQAFRNFIS